MRKFDFQGEKDLREEAEQTICTVTLHIRVPGAAKI